MSPSTSSSSSSNFSFNRSHRHQVTSFYTLFLIILALSTTFLMVQSAPVLVRRGEVTNLNKRVGGELSKGDLYSIGLPPTPDSYWSKMAAASASSTSLAPQSTPASDSEDGQGLEAADVTPTSSQPPAPTAASIDRGALYSVGIPPPPQGFHQRK